MSSEDFELKNSINCDCGYGFKLSDIKELKTINEHGFYGNLVKNYSYAKCPNCQKDVMLLLKQRGQTWEIINIATQKKINTIEQLQEQNKTENEENKEFICEVCKKVCKSQLGLNAHMKTHQN